jgi:alkyl hydroperoxide reductase subunit AhpF
MSVEPYDAIIVGGGPAGLNAALVLGRCRRRVLVCDAGEPPNAPSCGLHGFLSRDSVTPQELLRLGRAELQRYGVEHRQAPVRQASRQEDRFVVCLEDGQALTCRKLLLANTGDREEGTGDIPERIVFGDGDTLPRRGMFFQTGQKQQCDLAERFGRFGADQHPGIVCSR